MTTRYVETLIDMVFECVIEVNAATGGEKIRAMEAGPGMKC
jgi:hypothetical protein